MGAAKNYNASGRIFVTPEWSRTRPMADIRLSGRREPESRFGFVPIFASPSKWERNYYKDKNHRTDYSSVKLSMNFVLVGCHRPTDNEEWNDWHDGPSLFPPDEQVPLDAAAIALPHCHRRFALGQLTCHCHVVAVDSRVVANSDLCRHFAQHVIRPRGASTHLSTASYQGAGLLSFERKKTPPNTYQRSGPLQPHTRPPSSSRLSHIRENPTTEKGKSASVRSQIPQRAIPSRTGLGSIAAMNQTIAQSAKCVHADISR